MKIKRIEPFGADITFKYKCPNTECSFEHYVTYKESKTKNFKVVCDICDTVFTPKQIKSITINYEKPKPTPIPIEEKQKLLSTYFRNKPKNEKQKQEEKEKHFIEEAIITLNHFGFSQKEAKELVREEYIKSGESNPAKLVKLCLDFFGGEQNVK